MQYLSLITLRNFSIKCFCVLSLLAFCTLSDMSVGDSAAAPQSSDELRDAIKDEQNRVKKQKESLSRLSAQERKLNKNLANAEANMTKLEKSIAKQERELEALNVALKKVRASQDALEAKLHANEEDLRSLLETLWPLYIQQQGVQTLDTIDDTAQTQPFAIPENMEDLQNLQMMERDYMWAQELCLLIAARKKDMSEEEAAIAATLKEREALMTKAQKQMANISKDREKLLRDRLAFRQQLTNVRQQKKNAAEELNDVLAIIQTYNVRLEQMEGRDITKLKGYLSWPVAGKRAKEWNPSGKDPMRGIGFACNQGAKVKSVAWGKVVHNDILRGLGRVVILMHDKNYYTLYAYLGASSLKVGQTVKSGEIIGTAGFYPDVKSSGLYFELRFHQKPIDPRPWLSKTG